MAKTKYCLCNTKSVITKYNEMEERATTGVDSHQAIENQALLEANSQQSVTTVTLGKKTQFLLSLMF